MNSSGDAAESIVRMSLQGVEVAAKITGAGAKEFAVLLYTAIKDNQKISGKTNLSNMLRSGKELKVFSIAEKDFKKFCQEAKSYGVLYSALVNRKNEMSDGVVDVMVRAEDASKINRIVERYEFATIDRATIKSKIEKTRESKEKGIKVKSIEENLIDDILSKPINKEENEMSNPELAKTENAPLSEHTSKNKNNLGVDTDKKKPSVKKVLNDIKQEIKMSGLKEEVKNDIRDDKDNDKKKSQKLKQKNNNIKNRKNKKKNKGKER